MLRRWIFLFLSLGAIDGSLTNYPKGRYCMMDGYCLGGRFHSTVLYEMSFVNSSHFTFNVTSILKTRRRTDSIVTPMLFEEGIPYTFDSKKNIILSGYDGKSLRRIGGTYDIVKAKDLRKMHYDAVKDEAADLRKMEYDASEDVVKLKMRVVLFSKKNPMALSKQYTPTEVAWRLRKTDDTQLQWFVRELRWYGDSDCSGEELVPLLPNETSTGSNVVVSHNLDDAPLASDGDVSTGWRASTCMVSCYIGYRFPPTSIVRCIRLLQAGDTSEAAYQARLERLPEGETSYSRVLDFDFLTGDVWLKLNEVWVFPPNRRRWRIANVDAVKGPWTIIDMAFYLDSSCELEATLSVNGTPLSSPFKAVNGPARAFDWNPATEWTAECVTAECGRGDAWIGLHFDAEIPLIECVKMQQQAGDDTYTSSVVLQYSSGETEWSTMARYDGLFGGTRLVLSPMLPQSSWRVAAVQTISRQWDVRELELYGDPQCTQALHPLLREGGYSLTTRIDQGLVRDIAIIASTHDGSRQPTYAFDGITNDPSKSWRSRCSECYEEEAYIGLRWISETPPTVACVRAFFGPQLAVSRALVQYIGSVRWETAYSFDLLSGGSWLSLTYGGQLPYPGVMRVYPRYNNTIWRVKSRGWGLNACGFDMLGLCTVWTVEMFIHPECRGDPIQDGEPVSSLGVLGRREDPYNVYDNNDETGWLASLPYYDDYAGSYEDSIRGTGPTSRPSDDKSQTPWIGLVTDSTVQCVRVYESTKAGVIVPDMSQVEDLMNELSLERLVNEISFYRDSKCEGSFIGRGDPQAPAVIVSSSRSGGRYGGYRAFDMNTETYWQPDGDDHSPWIGILFTALSGGNSSREVKCIRILQPADIRHVARTVALETSEPNEKAWLQVQVFHFLSGGVWSGLTESASEPSPNTRWRIVNVAPLGKRLFWKVYDIRLYSSEECSEASRIPTSSAFGVTAIASGYTAANPPQNAFDADSTGTAWWAPCDYCGTAEAWIGVQFNPDRIPEGGIKVQCVTIGANALVNELLWALEVYDPIGDICREDPSARECWRPVDVTRKTCLPGITDSNDPECATDEVYLTTPIPEIETNPVETLVPDEDKREMSEMRRWETARVTIALLAALCYSIVHAAWLIITAIVTGAILSVTFAVGFIYPVRTERWASTDYHLYRSPLPKSRDFWFNSTVMFMSFAAINVLSILFDLACIRYVFAIFNLCVFGRDGCREPIPLAITALDVLALVECARYASLVHRKWFTWGSLSMAKGALTAACQVLCLASVAALKFLFDSNEQLYHQSSGCLELERQKGPPIASHAPFFAWLFGRSLVWSSLVAVLLTAVLANLSGQHFTAGLDEQLEKIMKMDGLGTLEQKEVDDERSEAGSLYFRQYEESKQRGVRDFGALLQGYWWRIKYRIQGWLCFGSVLRVICIGKWTRTVDGRGFQIASRSEYYSRVYLALFKEPPQPTMAVQYATAQGISLALQALPMGIVLGKLAEYSTPLPVRDQLEGGDFERFEGLEGGDVDTLRELLGKVERIGRALRVCGQTRWILVILVAVASSPDTRGLLPVSGLVLLVVVCLIEAILQGMHLVIYSYELSHQVIADQLRVEDQLREGDTLYAEDGPDEEETRFRRSGSKLLKKITKMFTRGQSLGDTTVIEMAQRKPSRVAPTPLGLRQEDSVEDIGGGLRRSVKKRTARGAVIEPLNSQEILR
ncbi:hypothetical protein FOL47_011062 [Perkinsus chesapeaki]|uniref:F5/8 type C domain-containing protein n=1 Tax=Perkinsus chesapeaki TaxID=330153 RepID=A0A7J6MNA2_PERCH|nr:hypothetical protein FOL47_011062 [Perkinsus chesapeaki]